MATPEAGKPAERPSSDAPSSTMDRSMNGWNAEYIERLYAQWKQDPASLTDDWNQFFLGFDLGRQGGSEGAGRNRQQCTGQGRLPDLPLPGHRTLRSRTRSTGITSTVSENTHAGILRTQRRPTRRAVRPRNPAPGEPLHPGHDHQASRADVLPPHRRRVHAHPGPGTTTLAAEPDGAGAQPA